MSVLATVAAALVAGVALANKAFTTARPSGSVRDSGANWMDGDVCCPSWTRPDGRKAGAVWSLGFL